MSPALSPLVSVLDRAADLIEAGRTPAKALRQAARELEEYANKNPSSRIPERRFELGERPVIERAVLGVPGKVA